MITGCSVSASTISASYRRRTWWPGRPDLLVLRSLLVLCRPRRPSAPSPTRGSLWWSRSPAPHRERRAQPQRDERGPSEKNETPTCSSRKGPPRRLVQLRARTAFGTAAQHQQVPPVAPTTVLVLGLPRRRGARAPRIGASIVEDDQARSMINPRGEDGSREQGLHSLRWPLLLEPPGAQQKNAAGGQDAMKMTRSARFVGSWLALAALVQARR